jgi:hypothetical protein
MRTLPPSPSARRRVRRQTLAAIGEPGVAAPSESRRGARQPAAAPACGPQKKEGVYQRVPLVPDGFTPGSSWRLVPGSTAGARGSGGKGAFEVSIRFPYGRLLIEKGDRSSFVCIHKVSAI